MVRDRGYPGSAVQVRRYVRTVRPSARTEAYLRLETLPGEQAQVDWGNFGALQIGRARRQLSCFVLVLSWSRGMYARFALDQALESFLHAHVEAFTTLGGTPRTILYDNLKSVVLERVGDHIRFHPRMLELAGRRGPAQIRTSLLKAAGSNSGGFTCPATADQRRSRLDRLR
jgi:transposase